MGGTLRATVSLPSGLVKVRASIHDVGAGYTSASASVIDAEGSGSGAVVGLTMSGGGLVDYTITSPGSNYSTPQITITGPGQTSPAVIAVNGTSTLAHHTRIYLVPPWPDTTHTLSHWLGTDPRITPRHDVNYMWSTHLVPRYHGVVSPSDTMYNNDSRIPTEYIPELVDPTAGTGVMIAAFPTDGMQGAGYSPFIGMIPETDATFIAGGGDPRGYWGVLLSGYNCGAFGIHYRDELTNAPLRFSQYPNLNLSQDRTNVAYAGSSSQDCYCPRPLTATMPCSWEIGHHPSIGYLSYLLTGRQCYLEELQFSATCNFLARTDVTRGLSQNTYPTVIGDGIRTTGWALRTLAQVTCATPDADVLRQEFQSSCENNISMYYAQNITVPVNPVIGSPQQNAAPGDNNTQPFMHGWFTASLAWMTVMKVVSTPIQANLQTFVNWNSKYWVGVLGGTSSTEYYFADATLYFTLTTPQGTTDWTGGTGPWFNNFGEMYQFNLGVPNPQPPVDNNWRDASTANQSATDHTGTAWITPIAFCVDAGCPGALAAYNRGVGASNWLNYVNGTQATPIGFNSNPVLGIKPVNVP
jgi:hypothetical protein